MSDAVNIFELYLESKQEPKMTTLNDGTKKWHLHGKLHREDGPAIEYANGTKHWYINDKRHREDGAAIEYASGHKNWYINGMYYADIESWAEAVLKHQKKPVTQDNIDELIALVMQQDLFS